MSPKSELILYQTEDNRTRIEVRLENETVWLTQAQLSDLFQRERSVITKHIRNIFEEGELGEKAVCANYAQTAADGKTYQTVYYNLDVIIAVGYRVKSQRGTQFAKNYLTREELKKLSLIVTQYLDFAELQALERRPMTMRDWIAKLDAFLRAGDREILEHTGGISAEEAKRKAELEFDKFDRQRRRLEDAQADAQFAREVGDLAKKVKQLKPPKRKK